MIRPAPKSEQILSKPTECTFLACDRFKQIKQPKDKCQTRQQKYCQMTHETETEKRTMNETFKLTSYDLNETYDLNHTHTHTTVAVSYTHLDVYKRQI